MKHDDYRVFIGKRVTVETKSGNVLTGLMYDLDREMKMIGVDDESDSIPYSIQMSNIASIGFPDDSAE